MSGVPGVEIANGLAYRVRLIQNLVLALLV